MLRKLLLVLLLAVAAVPALTVSARANSGQTSVMQDDRLVLNSDAATRERALSQMQALGVNVLRTHLTWSRVEKSPGAYDFSSYDALVNASRAHGIRVLMTITGPGPDFRSPCTRAQADKDGPVGACKPNVAAFQRFVTDVGNHFRGRVRLWTLWNEPNIDSYLNPLYAGSGRNRYAYVAKLYRALYRAGHKGLENSGHRNDTILLGDLSAVGSSRAVAPLTFYRDLFCIDSKGRALKGYAASIRGCKGFKRLPASGVAHHPYTSAAAASPRFKGGSRDIAIGSLGRLGTVLDQAVKRGRVSAGARTRIWITEFSFQGGGKYVSPGRQATYINWSEAIAFHNPRVRSYAQYELADDPGLVNPVFKTTGLFYSNWTAKPTLAAYRVPLYVTRASKTAVRVFGGVRPGGRQTVSIQGRNAGAWKTLKRLKTNGAGYFYVRLAKRKSWRVVWGTQTSRTAGVG